MNASCSCNSCADGYPFAWSYSLCERSTFFCPGPISKKLFRFLIMFSTGFTAPSILLLFQYLSPSSSLCTVFQSISSNIDEVLLLNPSANVFVFVDFNLHHKDWLTHSGGTDRFCALCYNLSIPNDLTEMFNIPT